MTYKDKPRCARGAALSRSDVNQTPGYRSLYLPTLLPILRYTRHGGKPCARQEHEHRVPALHLAVIHTERVACTVRARVRVCTHVRRAVGRIHTRA